MSKITDEKEKKDLSATLQELGLTQKESSVYLSLLGLGEVGASALVADTKLHRQFVYDALDSLEEKGLAGHTIVRGRKRFTGRSPSRIITMLEQKKHVAEEFTARLEKKLLPVDLQEFEVYRGPEAFVANELEIIKTARPSSKMYIFGGTGDDYEKTLGIHLTQYEYMRNKKDIEILYIGNVEQKDFLQTCKDNRTMFSYRILPQTLTGDLCITVYEDKFCFYMFGSPVTAITIKSKKMAKSYTDFFMGLWNISK